MPAPGIASTWLGDACCRAQYNILDTPGQPEFDDIVELAAAVCGTATATATATVTLIDEHRQWFKARIGWSVRETPRVISFCAHAILNQEPLVIPDTLEDRRFQRNPLVTGAPHIRFYAGGGGLDHGLDLEITESVLMTRVEDNLEKLDEVRGLGIRVAIDDFGTGYSSLLYLAKLPLDTLKVDRSFIVRMTEQHSDRAFVSTIVSLAHQLGLNVVAEGVDELICAGNGLGRPCPGASA